jgi:glycosyltransferase involved in cell wall biosynthesis
MKTAPNAAAPLAIVVPAYSPRFLRTALESIRGQTNSNFICYVFDDAAPAEVGEIAKEFPEFRYHRFEENWGSKDLVAHWNRCLERVDEEWVWCFSDDDVMDETCVEAFHKADVAASPVLVYRFALRFIGAEGEILQSFPAPQKESGLAFCKNRVLGRTSTVRPDHIFNKVALLRLGGFVSFPLAWHTDDATWTLLGKEHGIGVLDATVSWRRSGANITSQTGNLQPKFDASMQFYDWCKKMFPCSLSLRYYFLRIFAYTLRAHSFQYKFQPEFVIIWIWNFLWRQKKRVERYFTNFAFNFRST